MKIDFAFPRRFVPSKCVTSVKPSLQSHSSDIQEVSRTPSSDSSQRLLNKNIAIKFGHSLRCDWHT